MKNLLIIILLTITSCGGAKYNCAKLNSIERLSPEILIQKADSIAEFLKSNLEKKVEAENQGITIDYFFPNSILFKENCNSLYGFGPTYYIIGSMLKNEKMKIRIVGNSDSLEFRTFPNLSLERAEFIREIFLKNGIKKNRIEILDAKNERPFMPNSDNPNIDNRRVDFEIING